MFAMLNGYSLGDKFEKTVDNFWSFGNANDVFNREKLLDETNDKLAKLIHYGYKKAYNPKNLNIQKKVKVDEENEEYVDVEAIEEEEKLLDEKWYDLVRAWRRPGNGRELKDIGAPEPAHDKGAHGVVGHVVSPSGREPRR